MNTSNPTMGQQTITALFDKRSEAMQAVDELVRAGIARTGIKISPENDVVATTASTTAYDASRDDKGFWASLSDLFMPDEDRYAYSEAMHRGSIMVSAKVDAAQADRAEDILERHGTVNLEERETSWRKEGWSGYTAGAVASTGGTMSQNAPAAAASTARTGKDDEVLQEVEEQLRVGKRQVSAGRVKIRSYVVETPVSEQVSLHTETVHVDRRPVDRSAVVGEDAFRERTIEAQATSEEAIVSKEARVTGEVSLRKDVTDRTETITDKVRSTKVEVEDERADGQAPSRVPPQR